MDRLADSPSTDFTLIFFAAMALVGAVWLASALYAFWRGGKLAQKLDQADGLAHFFDGLLRASRRHPIWVWSSGKIQMAGDSRAILGIDRDITHLDQLIAAPNGATGVSGLPLQVIDSLRQAIDNVMPLEEPLNIDMGSSGINLLVDIQVISHPGIDWPRAVVWLEETISRRKFLGRTAQVNPSSEQDAWKIYDRLPLPVWMVDDSLEIIDANAAYISEVEAGNLVQVLKGQQSLFDRRPDDLMQQALREGVPVMHRVLGIGGGERKAFDAHFLPLGPHRLMGIAIDRTKEDEAMTEIARVVEAQSETLNRLRSPVAIFGAGQRLRFFNEAFVKLAGLSESYLNGDISHGELLDAMRAKRRLPEQADFQAWKQHQLDAYTSLISAEEELWHLPDGSAHRLVTQPYPFGGLLLLFEDITDRLALERSYNTLMAVQQETLDNMSEGVAVFSQDGRLRFANPSFMKAWQIEGSPSMFESGSDFGETATSLTQKPTLGPRPGIIASGALTDIRDLGAWISARSNRSGRYERGDGHFIDFALTALPDGGMLLTENDVSDTVTMERALRERSVALEAANRLRSQFITSMGYELRTPLNSILGFTEILALEGVGPLNEKQREYLDNILEAANSLTSMVSDVLDLAVIEAGAMELERSNIDFQELVDGIYGLARELASKNGMSLVNKSAPVGMVECDERRIKQAIYNLVSAMSLMLPHGIAADFICETTDNDNQVQLKLVVEEAGLPAHDLDNIVATMGAGGTPLGRRTTGLDLALTRSILLLHQGSMSAGYYGDRGLVIACALPRKAAEATIDEAVASALSETSRYR